jgi:hypothetical protein
VSKENGGKRLQEEDKRRQFLNELKQTDRQTDIKTGTHTHTHTHIHTHSVRVINSTCSRYGRKAWPRIKAQEDITASPAEIKRAYGRVPV